MNTSNLSRSFKLDVDAAGNVFIRDPGAHMERGTLPVFSTDTRDEAEALRVRHCRLARDDSGIYTLNEPPNQMEDGFDAVAYLKGVTELFRVTYLTMKCAELAKAHVATVTESKHAKLGIAVHEAVEKALREGCSPEDAARAGALVAAPDKASRQAIKNVTLMERDRAKGAGPKDVLRAIRAHMDGEVWTSCEATVQAGDLRKKGASHVRVLSINVEDGDAKVMDLTTKRKKTVRLVNLLKEYTLVERNYGVQGDVTR